MNAILKWLVQKFNKGILPLEDLNQYLRDIVHDRRESENTYTKIVDFVDHTIEYPADAVEEVLPFKFLDNMATFPYRAVQTAVLAPAIIEPELRQVGVALGNLISDAMLGDKLDKREQEIARLKLAMNNLRQQINDRKDDRNFVEQARKDIFKMSQEVRKLHRTR